MDASLDLGSPEGRKTIYEQNLPAISPAATRQMWAAVREITPSADLSDSKVLAAMAQGMWIALAAIGQAGEHGAFQVTALIRDMALMVDELELADVEQ